MKAAVKIIATNGIFKHLLDEEYPNCSMHQYGQRGFLIKTQSSFEIFINENPKVSFLENQGMVLEGYCMIENSLGFLSILITKLS
jgi:hypothetical protein